MDIVEDKAMVVTLRAKIPGKKNSTKSYGKEIFGKRVSKPVPKKTSSKMGRKIEVKTLIGLLRYMRISRYQRI